MAISVALLLGLSLPSSALAAEPKPDAAVKTDYVDASVTLDAAIKGNAALAANLLAEAKRWIESNRAEAATAFKAEPELFRDGRGWTFERNYRQTSIVGGRYVSIVRTDYLNTGGAHPNTDINTILWDDSAKKQISIRPFFKETADNGATLKALRAAAIAAVAAEKKKRGAYDIGDWRQGIEPKLLRIGAISLASSTMAGKSAGLDFHYPPYAAGAYVEGSYVVFVPWRSFKTRLSPQGAAIFAGERPPEAKADSK
ncbi:MAG: DUF3298 and DUF4163 domain-containing protein [Xanthobacteraceae bacterium]|nr:DUF3298 and DUF4163 domain-containing protein [Xanthobacteraceae bacterium]